MLGPLEIWSSGNRIEIGRPLQRRLVVALSLAADRAVHRDELIEAMWDTCPPSSCRQQLQNCVHALRRLLGDSVIDTASGGYRLMVDPSRVDVYSFADLARQARRLPADRAAPLLRRALGLWRGPALAGMGGALRVRAEALEEHRLTVFEQYAGLELDLGGHTALIPELKATIAEHPTRERLVGHLMVALYRSGRQSGALEVFHRLRKLLAAEQGVAPGVPLQRLYESVLRQDAQLAGHRVEVEFWAWGRTTSRPTRTGPR